MGIRLIRISFYTGKKIYVSTKRNSTIDHFKLCYEIFVLSNNLFTYTLPIFFHYKLIDKMKKLNLVTKQKIIANNQKGYLIDYCFEPDKIY